MEIIQCAKVSLSHICTYNSYELYGRKIYGYDEETNKKDKERFTGYMSNHTKKSIRMILDSWSSAIIVNLAKKHISVSHFWRHMTFATLTLSAKQQHSDKEIKREMLMRFLESIKYNFKVENFLWVAETQKNGNLHFHMLVDRPVPMADLQRLWNNAQQNLGYIDRFEQKHGHRNPNSTRIEAVKDFYDVYNYLCNYFIKKSSNRAVEGRIWSCSQKLSNIAPYSEALDFEMRELLDKLKNHKSTRKYENEYATMYYLHTKSVIRIFRKYLKTSYARYYLHLYRHLYENGIHPYESANVPLQKKPLKNEKPFLT